MKQDIQSHYTGQPEEWDGKERVQDRGHTYTCGTIHISVWEKSPQYCSSAGHEMKEKIKKDTLTKKIILFCTFPTNSLIFTLCNIFKYIYLIF